MINYKENNKNFKYFVVAVVLPIIGSIAIFCYLFINALESMDIVDEKKLALERINKFQTIITNIQNIRGLNEIKNKNNDIQHIKENIDNQIKDIKKSILQNSLKDKQLKINILNTLTLVKNTLHNKYDFKLLSKNIKKIMYIIQDIANDANFLLPKDKKEYILAKMVIEVFPEQLEKNAQLRGILSDIQNNKITTKQRDEILILISKIKEAFEKTIYIKNMLNQIDKSGILLTLQNNMEEAQNTIINFTVNNFLNQEYVSIKSDNIFLIISNNIKFIRLLDKATVYELSNELENQEEHLYILNTILISTFLSFVIFLILINWYFYKQTDNYIKDISKLMITDSMTDLYNRRYFDIEFVKQLKIHKRLKSNLVFIIMDIDFFKQYNDTYGHQAGDDAITAVSSVLKENTKREIDNAFRLGGEEFGIISLNIDKENTIKIVNKIRLDIMELQIEHSKNQPSKYLTISLGVIIVSPTAKFDAKQIYKKADDALYEAKQNGRNQSKIYEIQ